MAKTDLKARIFIGGRPLEDLSDDEREDFARAAARRMGETLNAWFGAHPEEYEIIERGIL